MCTWLDPIQHRLCRRPRCQLPIAGVGEAYGLCDGHGHEERNRRLAERDAKARAVTQRPIVRGLTVTPVDRPLSAIVGARPTPPIQPSAATVAAKEPPVPKPLVLKPNADALPPTVCRIADCDAKGHARGLCSPHYAAARANRSIEALALPSTQTKRPPKPVEDQRITTEAGLLAVLGTLPPPARGIVERLCTEAPKLRQDLADAVARAEATKRARQEQEAAERDLLEVSADVAKALGLDLDSDYLPARARDVMEQIATLDKLHAERDAAVARAAAAEKDQHALRHRMMDAESRVAELSRLFDDVGHALNAAIADLDKAVARAEAAERTLADTLEALCAEIHIDLDGGADWVLSELHDRIKSDAEKIRSADAVENLLRTERAELIEEGAEMRHWYAAARECAAVLGIDTPEALVKGAKALSMDQHPPATIGGDDVTLQWIGFPIPPKSSPHRVKQAGGRDLGVLVGHVTESGLFRVTSGPLAGAAYGCLYSAEPVERLVLGEPTPDRDVWVRTCIDEVTPHNIHTADGGRFRRSEWGPDRFAPVAKSTASTSPSSSAAVGEDDIPF